jgi:hypothetical protein
LSEKHLVFILSPFASDLQQTHFFVYPFHSLQIRLYTFLANFA